MQSFDGMETTVKNKGYEMHVIVWMFTGAFRVSAIFMIMCFTNNLSELVNLLKQHIH